jgi:glycosyltransferase involved in cell wall biosynthesis
MTGFSIFEEGIIPKLREEHGFETIDYKFKRGARAISSEYLMGRKVKRQVKKHGYDRVFVPAHTQMINIDPCEISADIVPYVHDALVLTTPFYSFVFNLKGRMWAGNVKKCSKILAGSKTTKKDLENRLGIGKEIKVVYQGTGFQEAESVDGFDSRDIDLLYVGTLRERKNPEVIKKTARMAESHGINMVAVNRTELDVACTQKKAVSRSQLEEIYRNTKYYLHPSHAEGFGRGPIEAQSRGAVPIAKDNPINREILGDSCIFSANPQEIINTISNRAKNSWAQKSDESIRNAERYSFDQATEKISRYVKGR